MFEDCCKLRLSESCGSLLEPASQGCETQRTCNRFSRTVVTSFCLNSLPQRFVDIFSPTFQTPVTVGIRPLLFVFRRFFQAACDVPELQDKFNVDEYSDLVTLTKPVIYISIGEIVNTHTVSNFLSLLNCIVLPLATSPGCSLPSLEAGCFTFQ